MKPGSQEEWPQKGTKIAKKDDQTIPLSFCVFCASLRQLFDFLIHN
jgi:hypothetical protein